MRLFDLNWRKTLTFIVCCVMLTVAFVPAAFAKKSNTHHGSSTPLTGTIAAVSHSHLTERGGSSHHHTGAHGCEASSCVPYLQAAHVGDTALGLAKLEFYVLSTIRVGAINKLHGPPPKSIL